MLWILTGEIAVTRQTKSKLAMLIIGAAVLLTASPGHSEAGLAMTAVNKANQIIDLALAAHGGAQRLKELNSVVQERTIVAFATQQSRLPHPPWDQSNQLDFTAFDMKQAVFVNRNSGAVGGFEFDTQTVIQGDESWQLDFHAATAARIAEPDLNTTSGPFIRVTAPLLLQQLDARRHVSHWLGIEEIEGRPHDVVTLVMEVGPGLSLYFDRESHMLARMERVLPPFGRVEYRFDDYELVGGIPFNRNFRLLLNDEPNLNIHIVDTQVNVSIDAYTAIPEGLQRVADIEADEFRLQEIDEGIFLVGGNGSYGLFVEMRDHIVALGGTQGVDERLAEVRKHVPEKPLRYGVLTHHHNDHIPGAAAYAKEGATIITFRENEAVVKDLAGGSGARFEFVSDHMRLSDGERVVELYDIGPTPHVEHLLIAYLPKEKIVFEGDHFIQPIAGPIVPAVSSTRALADALARKGLVFERIVGEHSPRIGSAADLAESVRTQPAVNDKAFRHKGNEPREQEQKAHWGS